MVDAPASAKPLARDRPNGQVWLADLISAWRDDLADEDQDRVAALCGFARARDAAVSDVTIKPEPLTLQVSAPAPIVGREQTEPSELRFFQATRYQQVDLGPVDTPPPEVADQPIRKEELRGAPYCLRPEPLQSWSRLWPHLHRILGEMVPGKRIDLPRLVHDMARLRPVQTLPRRHHPAWASRAHLLVDGDPCMDPFQPDVAVLLDRLRRVRGSEGLHCRVLPFGPNALKNAVNIQTRELEYPKPMAPGEPVLVLSDLGCFGRDPRRLNAWLHYGQRLRQQHMRPYALSPCPRDRWGLTLASVWSCSAWDRHERPLPGGRGQHPTPPRIPQTEYDAMIEALLNICSVPIRVEAPLLRELRLQLCDADAGLEHDLWHHREAANMPTACALRFEHAARRREALVSANDEFTGILKRIMPNLLRRHHRGHSAAVRAWETFHCRVAGLAVTKSEVDVATTVMRRCNRTRLEEIALSGQTIVQTDQYGLGALYQRNLSRIRGPQRTESPELAAACALEDLAQGGTGTFPEDIHEEAFLRCRRYVLGTANIERLLRVRLSGALLEFQISQPLESSVETGTPVGLLAAQTPTVTLDILQGTERQRVPLTLKTDPIPKHSIGNAKTVRLLTDRGSLLLNGREVPPWATRFGWDQCGLFAQFKVNGVSFDLRWIPPGEFSMGSPADEPGRPDWEGPQHLVTMGRGFWLGTTPVTQGQYAAVTDKRPAYFKHAGDRAPVEQVTWEECQACCQALMDTVDDLEDNLTFRLPSEAEWEYACRAGTTTALYTGALTIKGERDGPELDAIAWYSGNSGVDYAGAVDSSRWPKKQNEHSKAGTHPVAQKAPNHWGLHDMLGNVYEWCEDTWHDNYKDGPSDGRAWIDSKGERRVYRGGSWRGDMRYCRSASRGKFWHPNDRGRDVGFRLVLAPSLKG